MAAFTQSCTNLVVQLHRPSTDDVGVTSRSWNFGDGGTSTATNPSHTYAAASTYTVTLTVTDAGGLQNTTSHSVTVTAAPPPPSATLTGSGNKSKGTWTTSITWSGFDASVTNVDIYRNGANVRTVPKTPSSFTESGKGGGTFIYKVCAAGTSTCTNELTITI